MAKQAIYDNAAFVTSVKYDYAAADHSTLTLASGEKLTIRWYEVNASNGYMKGLNGDVYIPVSFGAGYCCLDEGDKLSSVLDQHINVGLDLNINNSWTHHQDNESNPLLNDPSIEGNYYVNPEFLIRNLTNHDISFNTIYLPVLFAKWQFWAGFPVRNKIFPFFNNKIIEGSDTEPRYSKINYFDETLIDISEDSVTSDNMLVGESAHDSEGKKIIGLKRLNANIGFLYTSSPNPALVVPAHGKIATATSKWNRNATEDRLFWDAYGILAYPDSSHVSVDDVLPVRVRRIGGGSNYNLDSGYLTAQSMRYIIQNPTDEDVTVGHLRASCSCIYGVTSWMRYYNWKPPETE